MNHTKMKVAQIGVGGFGAARRELMRQAGVFDLVAAYDHNPEALARAEAEDGAEPVESYEALLQTPGIEAVVISTGAKFHAEQVIDAAERGLHVFVEKPLCSTPDEMRELLKVWRRTGVVIGVGHSDHTADPVSRTIKRKIDTGELGTVATFEKTTCHAGGQMIQPGDWRGDPDKNPGGMLFQCGVHGVHELLYYFGPVAEVQAMFRNDVLPTGTDDVALCHLRFASGLVGTLNAYHASPYRHTFSVFGTRSNLYRFEHFFHEGTELLQQVQGADADAHQPRTPVSIDAEAESGKTTLGNMGGLMSFCQAIRDGTTPYPSLLDGARAVAVVFAAAESARQGRPIRLDDALIDTPQPTGAA